MNLLFKTVSSEVQKCNDKSDAFYRGLQKVSAESNSALTDCLTLQELHRALMSLENGKSPGIDGLPVKLFKTFWPVLGVDLLVVLNNSLESGAYHRAAGEHS